MRKFKLPLVALSAAVMLTGCQSFTGQGPAQQDPSIGLHGERLDQAGQDRTLAGLKGEGAKENMPPAEQLLARVDPALTRDGNFVQVERLARPAINEGLLISNALLNLFNMVPPAADATPAAAPIAFEASFVLKAFGNSQERVNTLLTALLPDVMRIDTTVPSFYGTLSTNGIPIGGRYITDDVIDITLGLIVPPETAAAVNGPLQTDNVGYFHTDHGVTRLAPSQEFPFVQTPY